MAPTGIIGMLIFCTKRHIDLESEVFKLIKILTIDSHLAEFIYKVEEFIDNSKQFNFFIHSSLHYFITDASMRHQIESASLEVMWMERVLQEMAQYYRSFDMGMSLLIQTSSMASVSLSTTGVSSALSSLELRTSLILTSLV